MKRLIAWLDSAPAWMQTAANAATVLIGIAVIVYVAASLALAFNGARFDAEFDWGGFVGALVGVGGAVGISVWEIRASENRQKLRSKSDSERAATTVVLNAVQVLVAVLPLVRPISIAYALCLLRSGNQVHEIDELRAWKDIPAATHAQALRDFLFVGESVISVKNLERLPLELGSALSARRIWIVPRLPRLSNALAMNGNADHLDFELLSQCHMDLKIVVGHLIGAIHEAAEFLGLPLPSRSLRKPSARMESLLVCLDESSASEAEMIAALSPFRGHGMSDAIADILSSDANGYWSGELDDISASMVG